ncbi:hypothetical protein CRV24_000130 [Beauveria bassiana]|nr:hypothetical protein CRV24_000130 [Beauveria bassiana]
MAKQSAEYIKSAKRQDQAEKDAERKQLVRNICHGRLASAAGGGGGGHGQPGALYLALISEGGQCWRDRLRFGDGSKGGAP